MSAAGKVWAVVPAAGHSRRMGVPKLALPYGDSTIAGTLVRTLLRCDLVGVVVVTRPEIVSRMDLPHDPQLTVALYPGRDMIDSVRHGLEILESVRSGPGQSRVDGVLVTPADIPNLAEATLESCLRAFSFDPQRIVIATRGGKPAHPMVFPFTLRHSLSRLHHGLRELRKLHPDRVTLVEGGDRGTEMDIDTWEEYVRVRAMS